MKSTTIETILLLASTCLPSSVLAAALPRRSDSWQPQPIEWKTCGDGLPKSIDCATLSVPLDWSNTDGEKITLGLTRLRATSDYCDKNLVVNPGGPGGIATSTLAEVAAGAVPVSSKLRKHYNLIGVDPRGIGSSTPLKCDISLWNERFSRYPQTEADFNDLVAHNKAVGESCLKLSGDLLKHVDTASVARDFEAVRQALGDEKLNLMGFSYGTQIAAQYAELFPESVGRFVLDGNVDHSGSETYMLVSEVSTYETEFDRFATWCGSSADCALKGKDVAALFDKLVKEADETPIPAPLCDGTTCHTGVTGEELRFNAQGLLIFKPTTWPVLGLALAQAAEGNATLLSTTLAVEGQDEANSALFGERAVICLDWNHPTTSISDNLYKQALTASIAPHTQGASQSYDAQVACLGWPAPVNNPPHLANIEGAPPMLLVNALYDPETSYTWAVGLQAQIPGSVLLTRDGDGHTSYFLAGEAAAVIDAFLVDGTLPEDNTVVNS